MAPWGNGPLSQLSPLLFPWFSETAALQMCSTLLQESWCIIWSIWQGQWVLELKLCPADMTSVVHIAHYLILEQLQHCRDPAPSHFPQNWDLKLPDGCGENGVMGETFRDEHNGDRYNLIFEDTVTWTLCRDLDAHTSKWLLKTAEALEESLERLLQYKTCVVVRGHLNSLHWRGWNMVV